LSFLRTRSMVSPAKAGSWAYGQEFLPDSRGDGEGGPGGGEGHLPADEGG
jgi:hypothetical protein